MNAAQRWRELPYTVTGDAGIDDVLYRSGDMRTIADSDGRNPSC
jgi:hypothetical protein